MAVVAVAVRRHPPDRNHSSVRHEGFLFFFDSNIKPDDLLKGGRANGSRESDGDRDLDHAVHPLTSLPTPSENRFTTRPDRRHCGPLARRVPLGFPDAHESATGSPFEADGRKATALNGLSGNAGHVNALPFSNRNSVASGFRSGPGGSHVPRGHSFRADSFQEVQPQDIGPRARLTARDCV